MKSRISIDFASVHGTGIEPFIKVELRESDDPRDKLVKAFFQNCGEHVKVQYQNFTEEVQDPGQGNKIIHLYRTE